jgi:hypothetical protein
MRSAPTFDPSNAIRFTPGQTILRRSVNPNGRIAAVETAKVVRDDDTGVLAWTAHGSDAMRRTTLTGDPIRKMPMEQRKATTTMLSPTTWHGTEVLTLTRTDGAAHSIWWFFGLDGEFLGWYVNLETPARRWYGGLDLRDQALDIWVEPDRTWVWKDEDEFAERTGLPDYWTAAEAREIRAEGESVIPLIEAGVYPFDGTFTTFRPDPAWKPATLPPFWDVPAPRLRS